MYWYHTCGQVCILIVAVTAAFHPSPLRACAAKQEDELNDERQVGEHSHHFTLRSEEEGGGEGGGEKEN